MKAEESTKVEPGEETTGTSNDEYNLVSVLYHALQGAETCETYIEDAEEAEDEELSKFFSEVQEEDRRIADRARALLVERMQASMEKKAA